MRKPLIYMNYKNVAYGGIFLLCRYEWKMILYLGRVYPAIYG